MSAFEEFRVAINRYSDTLLELASSHDPHERARLASRAGEQLYDVLNAHSRLVASRLDELYGIKVNPVG